MNALTVECPVHFGRRGRAGRKKMVIGPKPANPVEVRVPRVARLMALAIHIDGLVRDGKVASFAEVGRLGRVTSARMSQIMNLLNLEPRIQEEVLHLSPSSNPSILVSDLQPIAHVPDWQRQRFMWRALTVRKKARD